jgi:hypothetical protein
MTDFLVDIDVAAIWGYCGLEVLCLDSVDDLLIWEQLTQFFGEIYQPFFGIFL